MIPAAHAGPSAHRTRLSRVRNPERRRIRETAAESLRVCGSFCWNSRPARLSRLAR